MATLTLKNTHGGTTATFDGLGILRTAYGASGSDAIARLADQNFGPDTSTYKALMWYSIKHAKGLHIFIPGAVLGGMTTIANAWYRETNWPMG